MTPIRTRPAGPQTLRRGIVEPEVHARSAVITPAPEDWYPLFPNKVVGESLLDRLINNSYQVFMDGPSYRPNKRPGQPALSATRKTAK
jgi:hypothetical protein